MTSNNPGNLFRISSEHSMISNTMPRPFPTIDYVEGKYCIVTVLDNKYRDELYEASIVNNPETRFKYLPESVPKSQEEFNHWFDLALQSTDPRFYVIINKTNNKVSGRYSLLNIKPEHGTIELGHIHLTPLIAQSTAATEAMYLLSKYVFEELRYRRLEWKCDNLNDKSKRSARRLGFTFEGVMRQHLIVKGRNRDSAWFSIIDKEWPSRAAAFEHWLNSNNFDQDGNQINSLISIRDNILQAQGDSNNDQN